jgi:hypothetical protein
VRVWGIHGLDVNVLPKTRKGAEIFMSACRSVETRRGGAGVEVAVDRVMESATEVVYQITRKVRDEQARLIEHEKSMTLVYDKAQDDITVKDLDSDYASLRGLEDTIRAHFAKNQKTVPGPKIRNAIREMLQDLGAQNVRRKAGGLYFVPDTHIVGRTNEPTEPILLGMQAALAELYGERADFHIIPLVRDEEAEKMVAKHFALNAQETSRELLEKATNRLRNANGGKVRSDLLTNLHLERRKLAGAVAQFETLVGISRDEIDQNLEQLDEALEKLGDMGADA